MPELGTDGAISEDEGSLTDYSSSASENFGAGFQRQWDTNPVAFVGRGLRTFSEDWDARFGSGDLVSADDAREEVKKRGLDLSIPDGGISRYELDTLQYLKQREIGQETVSARPHGVGATMAGLSGGFAAGALDPINIASAFIPVVQEARVEAWLAQAGESTLARAAVRAKVGAIEGLVGAAAVEPINYVGAQSEQLNYGLTDSFVNIMFGGILGGGLHVLGGAAYDWRMRRSLTQLDIGLRAAMANAPDRSQLAAVQQATEALDNVEQGPVRAAEVLQEGLKPAQREALNAMPANEPAAAAPTREIPEAQGLAFDVKPIKESVAITPAGRRVPVLYAIADLDNLVTSHTKNLDENPAFPQELQPRDRARAQSEAQISNMTARLNPELLGEEPGAGGGAPIVDKTGIVESGNGRIIALQRINEGNPEKWREYQDFLKTQGYDVAGVAKPVLVRVRTGELSPDERVAFTREANAPTVSGLSTSEQARADAKALPDAALALHQGGDFRAVGNSRFVGAAIDALAPSQGERANMMKPDGSLSDEGARRLERALLAKAFGDDVSLITSLTEANEESGIKAIGGALVDVSPLWARMRADAANDVIEPSVDSTKNLLDAIRTIKEARAGGKNLLDMVNQVDLLAGDMDPKTITWVRAMFRNANLTGPLGRDKVGELLSFYATEARKQTPGPNLLGESGARPEQILATKREQDRRRGKQLELLGGQPGSGAAPGLFDAQARGDVPEPRPGEAGGPVGANRVGDVAPEERLKIFHASPYKFEKPSLEHIGAGEGAQVYGHGLYGAEARNDAAGYGMSRSTTLARFTEPKKWPAPDVMAQHLVNENNGARNAILDLEDKLAEAEHADPAEAKILKANLDYIRAHENELKVDTGHVYEWTVDARERDLIDVDKKLSDQPAGIITALKKLAPDLFDKKGKPKKIDGEGIYKAVVKAKGSAKKASAALREVGVKGVVYSSEVMGPEGREFVIFSDRDILESRREGEEPKAAPEPRAFHDLPEGVAPASEYVKGLDKPGEGETQKAYAKRVIDVLPVPRPSQLPDAPAAYFDISAPDTVIVPLDKVTATKGTDDKGAVNGLKRFAAARGGLLLKRAPIDVRAEHDGSYTIVDGNGTVNSAKSIGWQRIPVRVVEGERPDTQVSEGDWKAVGNEFVKTQAGWTVEQALHAASVNHKNLASLGDAVSDEVGEGVDWRIGAVKGRDRLEQKIAERGLPDAGAITDVVRGTFATETPPIADSVIAALSERATIIDEGWRRYPGHYVDRKLNIRFDDGQVGELIVISRRMLEAKLPGHKLLERSRGLTDGELDRQRAIDIKEMEQEHYQPAIEKDDGPWTKVYSERASTVGNGGTLPKVFEKPSGVNLTPERAASSNVGASMTDQPPSLRTNALSSSPAETKAAGVPSQLSQVTDISGGPSKQNMAPGEPEVNDRWAAEDAMIAAKAEEDVKGGKDVTVEDLEADAALYDAHLGSMRQRGLVTPEDEADILAAEQAAVDLDQRAAAYEAAGACEMEG